MTNYDTLKSCLEEFDIKDYRSEFTLMLSFLFKIELIQDMYKK